MNLHDYIQNNQEFWKDVESIGLVNTFNKWFLINNTFAELAIEYVEKITGEPKPQGNLTITNKNE